MLGLGAEENMVAVHAAFEPTGLIQPFEVAGDRVAILLEVNSFGIEGPVPVFRLNDPVPGDLDRKPLLGRQKRLCGGEHRHQEQ